MKIYLTTDTHFGHDKMGEYVGRPIGFEDKILKNLSRVPECDVMIHLGDVCIGQDERWNKLFLESVKCKKWLVLGNHDNKSISWYLKQGWDFVGDAIRMRVFGKNIVFSHTPIKDNGWFDINIHGHFHNNLHRLKEARYISEDEKIRNKEDLANLTSKHKLLAIENTYYQPVNLENFLKTNLNYTQ
jgi:calcineurin-like phosphoesterase family protein